MRQIRCGYSRQDMERDLLKSLPGKIQEAKTAHELAVMAAKMKEQDWQRLVIKLQRLK